MTIQEQITLELQTLDKPQLVKVAEFVSFLKFQKRQKIGSFDEKQLAALYAEFADEDRELGEAGMSDYAESLAREDAR